MDNVVSRTKVEQFDQPPRYNHNRRRTSLPAVLIAPSKPVLMEAKHFNELSKIISDLLNSVKDLSKPVMLSLDRIKVLLVCNCYSQSRSLSDRDGSDMDFKT